MTPGPPTVIVVVDDDAPLCALLAELLTAPGRVVDTVVGLAGMTADLIALSQPKLVLLNPRIDRLPVVELRALVEAVRQRTQARFVLMVSEADRHADLPGQLGADLSVPISVLLRDPLRALALQAGPSPAPLPEAAVGGPSVSTLSAEAILATALDEAWSVPPVSVSSAMRAVPALRQSSVVAGLEALIEEELAMAERPSQAVQSYAVNLDSLSDDNLVVRSDRTLDGLFVATLFPPRVGARVLLSVAFPWGATAEVEGVASWTRAEAFRRVKSGIGVTVTVSPELQVLADRFMALRQPARRPPAGVA